MDQDLEIKEKKGLFVQCFDKTDIDASGTYFYVSEGVISWAESYVRYTVTEERNGHILIVEGVISRIES